MNMHGSRFSFRLLLTGLWLLCLSPTLSAQTAQLRGTVVESERGEPLVGAAVFMPEVKVGAYTNDQGIYSLSKLPAGRYEVRVFYYGYDTLVQEVVLEPNTTTTQGFALVEKTVYANQVEIVGKQTGKIDKTNVDAGVTSITPQDIKLIPSLGSADLAQYLQVLPGVVFTGDQGGQLYIRGGTPIQNMVLLDGMIIYSPFHSIGLYSVFDPDYIRGVDVYSAAFPAEYGGRLSSIIDINTRNGNLTQFKGKLELNPFTAGALIEGPIGKAKRKGAGVSYLLSARNNFIDRTSQSLYGYVDDSVGLPFNFLDLYGKLTASDGVNYANLFGFRQTDNVNYEFPADIGWDAFGAGANFQLLPSGAGAIITGNLGYSSYMSSLESPQSEQFPRTSQISGFNGNLRVGYIFNSVDEFQFGLNLLGFQTDYVFTNSFGFRTTQQASNTEAAASFIYKKVLGKGEGRKRQDLAVIEPGLHIHYYNNQLPVQLEPRLRLKINLPRVSLSLAAGRYSQNLLDANSPLDVVNLFQAYLSAPDRLDFRLQNTNLQTAWHLLGGVEAEIFPNLTTSVEGWYKDFTQLTNINRDKLLPEEPNFIVEAGEAYGFDLLMKYQTPNWYLYSTYGWAKVTRTDLLDTEDPRTYPPVWDRRHTVNFVAAYKLGRPELLEQGDRFVRPKFTDSKWEFSLRWTYGSGFPFTQTQGYFEKLNFRDNGAQTDIARQNGQFTVILADEVNAGRLPTYHRLDVSAKRRWIIANTVQIETSVNLLNGYDRRNIFYYDRNTNTPVYQLPVIPTIGLVARY